MATKYSQLPESKAAFIASARPSTWRWKEDSQAEKLPRLDDYIDLVDSMIEPSFDFISQVLVKSGHIQEKDRKKIVKRLEKLGPEGKLYLEGVTVSVRIKTLKSCEDKILKDGKEPDEIGDYYGIKATGKTKADVIRLREAVLTMPNMTSSKCEITYPSEEYYASHKSHHVIENKSQRRLTVEFILTHADFEIIDQITHPIMVEERNLLKKIAETPFYHTDLIEDLKSQLAKKKFERSEWNYHTLIYSGLHEWSAPDAPIRKRLQSERYAHSTPTNLAHKIISTIAPAFEDPANTSHNDVPCLARNFA